MVTGAGEEVEISAAQNADMLPAAQVALGALGIYTEIQMQLVARHKLHRRVWFAPYYPLLSDAPQLWRDNRTFEFFYLPSSGQTMCITPNSTEAADTPLAQDES